MAKWIQTSPLTSFKKSFGNNLATQADMGVSRCLLTAVAYHPEWQCPNKQTQIAQHEAHTTHDTDLCRA